MKLFYFLDFLHVKNYGIPVTYDNYVHLELGPVPSTIKNLIDSATDDLENSFFADTIYFERPDNTNMYRIKPIREFTDKEANFLSKNELDILNKVCLRFADKTTEEIKEISHSEAPWKDTSMLETIPYSLAGRDKDSKFTEEELTVFESL